MGMVGVFPSLIIHSRTKKQLPIGRVARPCPGAGDATGDDHFLSSFFCGPVCLLCGQGTSERLFGTASFDRYTPLEKKEREDPNKLDHEQPSSVKTG